MSPEQEKAILRYEELKIEIKNMDAQIKELKPIIQELVHEDEKLHTPTGYGYFELKKRDNWKFSEEIVEAEKGLKTLKAEAIAKGEATSTPTVYIEYRQNKNEE